MSLAALPPGIEFIISNLPRLLLPPALTVGGVKLFGLLFDLYTPSWLYIPLSLVSLPFVLACRSACAEFRNRRQAALHGAVLAPSVPSRWPVGLDLFFRYIRSVRSGYMGEVLDQFCSANGNTISISFLGDSRTFTIEPEHIKVVLATQFNSFYKGGSYYDVFHSLLGTGILNSDGDIWRLHRSMARPFFNKDRVGDFEIFEKHADDALEQLKARLKEGYPVDFQDMISRFTLDSATEFLFGRDVRTLSAGLVYPEKSLRVAQTVTETPSANTFAHAFIEAQIMTAVRATKGGNWRLFEFWGDSVTPHMQVCYKFIDPILKEALYKKRSLKGTGNVNDRQDLKGDTLLDHLVDCTEDLNMIKEEVMNVMIAGRDTTASTMTSAVWMLSQHPDVLHRLRKEILSVVGNSRCPTPEELREMKYLRAVIDETLRLYPAVPFNARTSMGPVIMPAVRGGKPIYIPPNTRVPSSVFLMQRRKDLWGPDAEEFDPDRFLDERLHKYLIPNPSIFQPFSIGPRICLGQQFAYNEMSYFLTRLLQRFSSISLAEDVQKLAPAEWALGPGRKAMEKVIIRSHLTIYVEGGLWVRMEEANSDEDAS